MNNINEILAVLSKQFGTDEEVNEILVGAMEALQDLQDNRDIEEAEEAEEATEEEWNAEVAEANAEALAKPYRLYLGEFVYGFDTKEEREQEFSGWTAWAQERTIKSI